MVEKNYLIAKNQHTIYFYNTKSYIAFAMCSFTF